HLPTYLLDTFEDRIRTSALNDPRRFEAVHSMMTRAGLKGRVKITGSAQLVVCVRRCIGSGEHSGTSYSAAARYARQTHCDEQGHMGMRGNGSSSTTTADIS